MTTIEEEMDEFFDFEDAAHPLDHSGDIDFTDFPSGPYDVNLAFAEPENDENSFACLQHFINSEPPNLDSQNAMTDTAMLSPADFTDFARWIDGSGIPTKPCVHCRRMRIHCKIINEGLRRGSCTSCVALARTCSLTHDPEREQYDQNLQNDKFRCTSAEFCLPGNTVDDSGDLDYMSYALDPTPQACDYCCGRGYQCKQIQEGGRLGACTSCVALELECNLAPRSNANADGALDLNSTWMPTQSPLESPNPLSRNNSTPTLLSLRSSEENMNAEANESNPKVGARFSRESVRILRGWLSTHHRHPYPTDEEKEALKRQTGLNKTQITNWLANARRRGKVRAPRSTSPSVSNYSKAMDIPRRSTPALESMNPLERWKHSPPENEPASVSAIAKAVTSSTWSSGRESPYTTSHGHSDDGSARSLCNVSSTSSLGTSHSSGGSFASAFSHKSRGSFGSFGNRGRRRRRRQAPKPVKLPTMNGPVRTFQCTFCTETFKTKHDWQRHEKSLHLSLERWICCPNGPTQFDAEYEHNRCVFCGLPNPPAGHAESHNFSSCADRALEERTFYRKDHLRQHLNLVHDAKFQGFSMECWKVMTPEIRSRCGFCGIVMGSWSFRVDHLAEHFKGGKSMADWKGDWGFDPQVLDIVENGMPPYLIHDERNTPEAFEASRELLSDFRTLEDLIKIGVVEYINERVLKGGMPTDEDLLREASYIIRKSDEFFTTPGDIEVSWFRDLILFSGESSSTDENGFSAASGGLPWTKKLEPIATPAPYSSADLTGVKCSKERALKAFVDAKQALGLTPTDSELQLEACRILDEVETTSNFKCKGGLAWFKYLVVASTKWLEEFRRRASLPRTSEMHLEHIYSMDDKSIDYSIHNTRRVEVELTNYVKLQLATGVTPTDADLQREARLLVYKNDDPWNQTVIDDPSILLLFKRQNGLTPESEAGFDMPTLSEAVELGIAQQHSIPSPKTLHWDLEQTGIGLPSPSSGENSAIGNGSRTPNFDQPLHTTIFNQPSANSNPVMPLRYFLNDANCYGRLVRELSRFVTTCTSANNPNSHIPTDAEIQNQARWIIYDDDDPWNQPPPTTPNGSSASSA
ncbi:Homeobox protein, partial [Lachnellula suecica]